MGTLIENINAISKIKADLNKILRENGSDGGPVFMDYPDKFRELFRIVDDYADATEDTYVYQIPDTQTVVPDPVITYYQNVVTITCSLDKATIRYWIVSDSGRNNIGLTTLQKGQTIYLSENSTVYCYAQYREEKSNEVSLWVPVDNIEIPIPPVIERDGTTVTITSEQGYDIYYKIGSGGTYYLYDGPIEVARTEDVYSFTRGYRANSDEVVDKAPEQPTKPLPPVITCIENVIYITCETENVSLFYKEENGRWMQYTGPVSITESGFYYAKSVNSYYMEAISNKKYCEYKEPAVPVVLAGPVISCSNNIVTITCSTSGSEIYYSTDGSNYSKYTQPISIQEDTNFYAFSLLNGETSDIVGPYTAEYEEPVVVIPAIPVISCSNNIVTITCSTYGATIYYSDTGNTGPWTQYTQPFEIQSDKIFWAYSSLNGQNSDVSDAYEADYILIQPSDPVITCTNNVVTITCSTPGATIYYSIDGGNIYNIYSSDIRIYSTTVFKSYSSLNGQNSNVITKTAQYVSPIATPVFSINNNVVTITCSTYGATIYYSTNGDYDDQYVVYTNPITISQDTEFWAYAELSMEKSNYQYYYADYEIITAPDVPVITYNWNTIYISCSTPGATIQYQYQGESTWHTYTSMIDINADKVIRARSYKYELYSDATSWVTCTYDSDYSNQPLTFIITSNGNIVWKKYSTSANNKTIYYSLTNGYTWEQVTSNSLYENTISVNTGDKVIFKGTNNTYGQGNYAYYSGFGNSTCSFNIKGNIMSMIYGDNFLNKYSLPNNGWTFYGLFSGCNISNANNLVLPATTLTEGCYYFMFENCSNLTAPPSLPATTLAESCYQAMFSRTAITSYTLPNATLARGCYAAMFAGCASLTSAPVLNQTTLARNCYEGMFSNCTSLVNPPALPSTNLAPGCYMGMFGGCTSLTSAPSLPATTLRWCCYSNMFEGCSSLVNAPATLPATWSGPLVDTDGNTEYGSVDAYYRMFYGCTSLINAPEIKLEQIGQTVCYEMFGGCVNLRNIKCMATAIGYRGTYNWLNGVFNTGTFTKKTGATQWSTGYSGIPSGWTVQESNS